MVRVQRVRALEHRAFFVLATMAGLVAVTASIGCRDPGQPTGRPFSLADFINGDASLTIVCEKTSETRVLGPESELYSEVMRALDVQCEPVIASEHIRGTSAYVVIQDDEVRARLYLGPYLDVILPDGTVQYARLKAHSSYEHLQHKLSEILKFGTSP